MAALLFLVLVSQIIIIALLLNISSYLRRVNTYIDFIEQGRKRTMDIGSTVKDADPVVVVVDGHKVRKSQFRDYEL